jgi:hypothetical protein
LDPVAEAAPPLVWIGDLFNAAVPGSVSVTATVDVIAPPNYIGHTSTPETFIIEAVAGSLQQAVNYYNRAVANNTTLTELRRIINYQYLGVDSGGQDRAAITLESSYSDAFALGDTIVISDPSDFSSPLVPLVFVPSGKNQTNSYIEYVLYNQTLNEYRKVNGYDYTTHLLRLDTSGVNSVSTGPVIGWQSTDTFALRLTPPILYGAITNVINTTTVTLPAAASSVDDFYYRYFLRMTSGAANNQIGIIVRYDGTTRDVTVSPGFTTLPAIGDTFEILAFSYDNAVPFVYTGSLVSQQEEVCYEISLLNLVLPNETLNTGSGTRIAFYPYVYVEFSNISGANAGVKNIIYSNNPNSTRMLFRAVVQDTNQPIISSFIKLDGSGMTQTIKFKPNDNLRFSVRLPSGAIYDTVIEDTTSPYPPNAQIQISALFSIKRLS